MIKATIAQTKFLLKKRESVFVFLVLFGLVIKNFIENVLEFQGWDVLHMYHPMKLLLLSYNRTYANADNTLLLIQLYPLLVVFAAGFSLSKEQQNGMRVSIVSRTGRTTYLASKLLAAFLATMIVFTVPFLLEIILNYISFPVKAVGDMWNFSPYSSEYLNSVNEYFMTGLYFKSVHLYAVVGTVVFGMVSGLFGALTVAISSMIKVKYNLLLFLPVFFGLNISTILQNKYFKNAPSIKWYDYILIFDDNSKNIVFGLVSLFVIIAFLIAAVWVNRRKDCL